MAKRTTANLTPAKLHLFTPATERFVIGTLDSYGKPVEIVAQYNPKELSLQAQAKWEAVNGNGKKPSGGNQPLAWGGTDPQIMTAELLFDGVEENISIRPLIDDLISLTEPREMNTDEAWLRRPPLCVAIWGSDPRRFRCIVQTVATRITMFSPQGLPLRATCTVTLKEANVLVMWSSDDHGHDHAGDVAKSEFHASNAARNKVDFDLE
jgi:Contractile injection system tube protein